MEQFTHFSEEVIDFIIKNEHIDPYDLVLGKSPFPDIDIKTLSRQIMGRKIARKKFPFLLEKDQYRYHAKESLEQSSSEATGIFKSNFLEGESFVDLTGGMGIDTYLLGRKFRSCSYVEPNLELSKLAHHNFGILNFDQCEVLNTTCEQFLETNKQTFDWAYIDPSRRISGSRRISIHEYEPNVVELQNQLLDTANNVFIKLSPMQDISECVKSLDCIHRIWVISVHNEVKELLLHLNKEPKAEKTISAVNIKKDKTDNLTVELASSQPSVDLSAVQAYIYQPNASIVKAGIQNQYAQQMDLKKLHPNTQLYTQNGMIKDFFGKIYKVDHILGLNKKEIHRALPERKVNIISKNFPLSPEELSKKLKLKSGGERFLIAFTDSENKRVIAICDRIQ